VSGFEGILEGGFAVSLAGDFTDSFIGGLQVVLWTAL